MNKKEKWIFKKVNNALYFADSADYETTLWQILNILKPELFEDAYKPELEFIENIEDINNQKNDLPSLGQLPRKGNRRQYPECFEGIWEEYPDRDNNPKGGGYEKYRARRVEGIEHKTLLQSTKNYKHYIEQNNVSKKYIKMARTFFGPQDCWQEYTDENYDKKENPVEFDRIKEIWNKILPKSYEIKYMTTERRRKIQDIWDDGFLESESEIKSLAKQIYNSDYLTKQSWFSFDWVIKSSEKVARILEGKYNNTNEGSGGYGFPSE